MTSSKVGAANAGWPLQFRFRRPHHRPGMAGLSRYAALRFMSLSPDIIAKIQAVEAKLTELDPILHEFCSRRAFTFSSIIGCWPRRKVWARQDIDRVIDLTMDLTVPEFFVRGFQPNVPWSLCASASLPVSEDVPSRILRVDIFRHLPFSEIAGVLAARLEEGFRTLGRFTREDVLAKGKMMSP
jgi:hypothetical protein